MNTEDDALKTLRELAAWADASEELSKLHTYGADAKGNSYKLPPPGLSAAARLAWANAHQAPPKRATPAIVSLEEIGMSAEEFDKLSGYQKLILVNRAAARRAVPPALT